MLLARQYHFCRPGNPMRGSSKLSCRFASNAQLLHPVYAKQFNFFNHQIRQAFSSEKEFISHASKMISVRELDKLKLDLFDGKARGSFTHCQMTALIIEKIASEVLFCNPIVSLAGPDLSLLEKEMRANENTLYQFYLDRSVCVHFFTVVKFPGCNETPVFFLYQSFRNEYDVIEYMDSKHFSTYSFSDLNNFLMQPLRLMMENRTEWNQSNYDSFKQIFLYDLQGADRRARICPTTDLSIKVLFNG